jgi:hypothetical protein
VQELLGLIKLLQADQRGGAELLAVLVHGGRRDLEELSTEGDDFGVEGASGTHSRGTPRTFPTAAHFKQEVSRQPRTISSEVMAELLT